MSVFEHKAPIAQDRAFHIDFQNGKSYQSPNTFVDDFVGGEQGAFVNSPTVVDGALQLNGIDEQVNLGNDLLTNYLTGVGVQWTIQSWIKPTGSPNEYDIVVGNWSPALGFILSVYVDDSIRFLGHNGSTSTGIITNNSIVRDEWQLITWVFDGSQTGNDIPTIYINDTRYSNSDGNVTFDGGAWSQDITYNVLNNLVISGESLASPNPFGGAFGGEISDLIIYPRVLSQSEVSQNLNSQKSIYGN